MFVVDTNLLIYAAMVDAPQHERARSWVAACAGGSQRSPSFALLAETDRHLGVLADLTRDYPQLAGNIMHDLHTVALMREHGVREIHTADKDFLRFRDLRVVNPLAA